MSGRCGRHFLLNVAGGYGNVAASLRHARAMQDGSSQAFATIPCRRLKPRKPLPPQYKLQVLHYVQVWPCLMPVIFNPVARFVCVGTRRNPVAPKLATFIRL